MAVTAVPRVTRLSKPPIGLGATRRGGLAVLVGLALTGPALIAASPALCAVAMAICPLGLTA